MATRIEDRWLWLGLGVFTLIAIKAVEHGLRTVVTLTEAHHSLPKPRIPLPPSPPQSPPPPENAIQTESLEILAKSDNVGLRNAATRILCGRLKANEKLRVRIVKAYVNGDAEGQRRARQVLKLVTRSLLSSIPSASEEQTIEEIQRDLRAELVTYRRQQEEQVREQRRLQQEEQEDELITIREQRRLLERRLRREAVVINEGDRPVSQDDVYMRDDMGDMELTDDDETEEGLVEVDAGRAWLDILHGPIEEEPEPWLDADGLPIGPQEYTPSEADAGRAWLDILPRPH